MGLDFNHKLKPFYAAAMNPRDYAVQWKQNSGRDVIGFFCSYAPEEIMLASGALPFRIFNGASSISLADAHLQAYSCSLVRGALDDALNRRLDFLKGTVFPHTCDSIQRLSDIWRLNLKLDFHLDVVLPVILNTDSARHYMIDVLKKFRRELENELGVSIDEDRIRSAVNVYNQIRKRLKKLHHIRIQNPTVFTAENFYTVVKSAMIMDRIKLPAALSELIEHLEGRGEGEPGKPKKRIVLAGGLCNMPEIFKTIETCGGSVINDDFCTGRRYYEGQIDTGGDIFESIADRYLNRINCPAKHSGLHTRGQDIVQLAKESQADGVIFLHLKFCDPHAFDYPYLKNMLDQAHIPCMLFELEDQQLSEGQFRTRCEAFIEMLSNGQ